MVTSLGNKDAAVEGVCLLLSGFVKVYCPSALSLQHLGSCSHNTHKIGDALERICKPQLLSSLLCPCDSQEVFTIEEAG